LSSFLLETLVIFVLIAANGLLAMSEIAIIAARKARLQHSANSGDAGARTALELATHPNRFLATVQIGITLVGILAGAFGGATLGHKIERLAFGVPALAPYGSIIGVGVVVVGVAFFAATLVLQEMAARLGAVGRTGLGEALRASIRQPVLRATAIGLALVAITFGNAAYQAGNLTGAALGLAWLSLCLLVASVVASRRRRYAEAP